MDEGPGGRVGVMGRTGEHDHPGPTRDNLTVLTEETLKRTELMEPRTPPPPKRPLPQHHKHGSSSFMLPRPNSVAGICAFSYVLSCYSAIKGTVRNRPTFSIPYFVLICFPAERKMRSSIPLSYQ